MCAGGKRDPEVHDINSDTNPILEETHSFHFRPSFPFLNSALCQGGTLHAFCNIRNRENRNFLGSHPMYIGFINYNVYHCNRPMAASRNLWKKTGRNKKRAGEKKNSFRRCLTVRLVRSRAFFMHSA